MGLIAATATLSLTDGGSNPPAGDSGPMFQQPGRSFQERRFEAYRPRAWSDEVIAGLNTPYDGRFIFARIRFTPSSSGWGRRSDVKWDHDYPRAELNLGRIVDNISNIDMYLGGGNIINIGDPELFEYPWSYLCEPGYWTMTDEEAENLRNYLFKGGFLVIDDFFRDHWYNFQIQMERLLPGYQLHRMDATHPVFHSFFDIEDLSLLDQRGRRGAPPSYFGVYEENDPEKRLMVIINYDNDIGDWWEWSDQAYTPIELSNEAYKLGINYIIYSMAF
jgi:hypothetical protein